MRCHAPRTAALQRKADSSPLAAAVARRPAPNQRLLATRPARLPEPLKTGVERLSGLAMDDVRVHRDSPEPARLGALAYTKGSDIHLGPGQEQHLPHEAWHVVQQMQGRVQATEQRANMPVNAKRELEQESDEAAANAIRPWGSGVTSPPEATFRRAAARVVGGEGIVQLKDGPKKPPLGIRIQFDELALKALQLSAEDAAKLSPAFLIDTFRSEYGLEVAVKEGRLVYIKDVPTSNKVSQLAKQMWKKELKKDSEHAMEFTWDNPDVEIAHNIPYKEHKRERRKKYGRKDKRRSDTIIDLGEFNLAGNKMVTTAEYENLDPRAFNLARILEHEFLGHGVKDIEDNYSNSKIEDNFGYYDPEKHPGNTVYFGNKLAKQMGIPLRSVYTAKHGLPYEENGVARQDYQITFEKDGVRGSIIFRGAAPADTEVEKRGDWFDELGRTWKSPARYGDRLRR